MYEVHAAVALRIRPAQRSLILGPAHREILELKWTLETPLYYHDRTTTEEGESTVAHSLTTADRKNSSSSPTGNLEGADVMCVGVEVPGKFVEMQQVQDPMTTEQ